MHKRAYEVCFQCRSEPNSRQSGKTITFKLLGGIDLVMVGASKGESGLVAQLEERRLCEAEALGSNPSESIKNRCTRQD